MITSRPLNVRIRPRPQLGPRRESLRNIEKHANLFGRRKFDGAVRLRDQNRRNLALGIQKRSSRVALGNLRVVIRKRWGVGRVHLQWKNYKLQPGTNRGRLKIDTR